MTGMPFASGVRMRRNHRRGLLCVAALCLLGCGDAKSDAERICPLWSEMANSGNVPLAERPSAAVRIFRKQSFSSKTRKCVDLLDSPGAPPHVKFAAFERCLHDAGATGWSCEPMRAHYEMKPVSVPGD